MAAFSRPAWSAVTGQRATTGPVKGVAQLVREATDGGRLLIDTLVQIATGPDSSDRDKVSASSILLDRGFGRGPRPLGSPSRTPCVDPVRPYAVRGERVVSRSSSRVK